MGFLSKKLSLILTSKVSSFPNLEIGTIKLICLESRHHKLFNNITFKPNGGQKCQKLC